MYVWSRVIRGPCLDPVKREKVHLAGQFLAIQLVQDFRANLVIFDNMVEQPVFVF